MVGKVLISFCLKFLLLFCYFLLTEARAVFLELNQYYYVHILKLVFIFINLEPFGCVRNSTQTNLNEKKKICFELANIIDLS